MKRIVLATLAALMFPAAAMACESQAVGDLIVRNAWSRVTIGTSRPAVFYVELLNRGSADDALLGISTPVAGMPMLHETVVKDGVASMPHAMEVPVPAGEAVKLAPGGFHGMLMELNTALKEGDSFPVTLNFRDAGEVTINAQVLSMRAQASECADAPS